MTIPVHFVGKIHIQARKHARDIKATEGTDECERYKRRWRDYLASWSAQTGLGQKELIEAAALEPYPEELPKPK